MSIMQKLNNVIEEYIHDFLNKQNRSYVVKPAIPIVWFGNMEKYRTSPKKIVTIGINPSWKEFEKHRFDMVDFKSNNAIDELMKTLNSYFKDNPYDWFDDFEKILKWFDASYYEHKNKTNIAIHIDIYSAIATNPIWGSLSKAEQKDIQRIDLFNKLLNSLDPDVILFSVNQEAFKDVFYKFKLEKSANIFQNKKGVFMRKYRCGDKILISGRNMQGQPFCGMNSSEIQEAMQQLVWENVSASKSPKSKDVKVVVPANSNPVTSKSVHSEKKSNNSIWSKPIESMISYFEGYATSKNKEYLMAVLDILSTENKSMTVDEVRQKCFNNYHKYGIEDDEDGKNRKIIYECLYQHSDCNQNSNADKQSKLFVRDNLKRYAFDPNLKLW